MIDIEIYNGIKVLRDDKIRGGTKSFLIPHIINDNFNEYVYSSSVYGGFQITLSIYCKENNKKATIFCPKRKELHRNTKICLNNGANIIEVPYGYLRVLEKRANDYCKKNNTFKINFGANNKKCVDVISQRMKTVITKIEREPEEIWCAVGSGTLVEGILKGTENAKINGVLVGANYENNHKRLNLIEYPKEFKNESKYQPQFQSMPNFDLKAWELCNEYKQSDDVLFWNVM